MKTENTLDAIFAMAIDREEAANRFYAELARRVKNQAVRETFEALAKEELSHRTLLQALQADPQLGAKLKPGSDFHVAESEAAPDVRPDMPLRDAVALAMKKEQQAVELYRGLARVATDAGTHELFENLMNMELGHKSKLESVFVDIGYAEVF